MPEPKLVARQAGFAALGLSKAMVASITALGYEEPTPVQRETIPLLLDGRDLLGQAATGTGKTAAFALPMLQRIDEAGDAARRHTAGLVLVPTRELAMQVAEAVHKYARGTELTVAAALRRRADARSRSARSSVARASSSPRRVARSITSGASTLALDKLRVLVLDEADEMLDMGFAEDLDAILEATPEGTADRALLGDDAAADPVDRRAPSEEPGARHDRARESGGGQAAARAPGRLHRRARRTSRPRSSACSKSRTRRRRWCSAGRVSRSTRSSRR